MPKRRRRNRRRRIPFPVFEVRRQPPPNSTEKDTVVAAPPPPPPRRVKNNEPRPVRLNSVVVAEPRPASSDSIIDAPRLPRLKSAAVVPEQDTPPPQLQPRRPEPRSTEDCKSRSYSSVHNYEHQDHRSTDTRHRNEKYIDRERSYGKDDTRDKGQRKKEYDADQRKRRSRGKEKQRDKCEGQQRTHTTGATWQNPLGQVGPTQLAVGHVAPIKPLDKASSPLPRPQSPEPNSTEDRREASHGKEEHTATDERERRSHGKEKQRDECEDHHTKSATWQAPLGQVDRTQLPADHVAPPDDSKHEVRKDVVVDDDDDNHDGGLAAYYLSIADISKELTKPETYDKCQRALMKKKPNVGTNEDDHEEANGPPKILPSNSFPSSLLPGPNESVFKRAMSLYKKQKEENTSLLKSYLKGD